MSVNQVVGPGRLELPTPRLSSVCSNQLSYGPICRTRRPGSGTHTGQRPSPVVRRPRRNVSRSTIGGTTRERKPKVHILMKKEKRSRRFPPYRQARKLCGVFRCDGRLTGAICVLKSGFRSARTNSYSLLATPYSLINRLP